MINGAMVIVECDECGTVEYIDLVQEEAGMWEERGLRNELEGDGWYTDWNEDLHLCPVCKESREKEEDNNE